MSSNTETNYENLVQKKPYLTKSELSLLLGKQGRNLDKKILRLLKKNELISLKKGLYIHPVYLALHKGSLEEYIANILYYPSYLSLEYVLQKEGLIPEAVYTYTSITSKVPRLFSNKLGTFTYRHIKPTLFTGYSWVHFSENYQIKIATRAKALFDFIYLKPMGQNTAVISQALFEDLRINWDNFSKKDIIEFMQYATNSESKKMMLIGKIVERRLS